MQKGLSVDTKNWAIQAFNPQAIGTTNGANVTVNGQEIPLKNYSAFRTTANTTYTIGGQSVTLPQGMVTACFDNEQISLTAGVIVELM